MMARTEKKKIPVVGIGASAGGLKEFERFFQHIPGKLNAAFVLIQHLDPNYKSVLAEIVGRYTDMKVVQATQDVELIPNKVYIIPPGKTMKYKEGKLKLSPLKRVRGRQLPIDEFFKSLATGLREKSVGIILSGTGTDGTGGIKKIKECGGLTIVQEPSTAQQNGMPESAMNTGLVDVVSTVEKMPAVLYDYINSKFDLKKLHSSGDARVVDSVQAIVALLRQRSGHNFSGYKQNTLLRRIERRLVVNKINDLDSYLKFLKKNEKEQDVLFKELLISVTSFFRDKDTFAYFEKEIAPEVAQRSKGEIRIWVAGCATGEEAYSYAMIFDKYLVENKLKSEIRIFASDIDSEAIQRGRLGYYPENIVSEIPKEYLDTYFSRDKNGFRVKKALRQKVIFAEQNFIQNPPYSNIDIVSCRNVLIYMDSKLQERAITVFHFALRNQGILMLGNSESLGKSAKYFNVENRNNKVFRKITSRRSPNKFWRMTGDFTGNSPNEGLNEPERPLSQLAEEYVLKRHIPPSVITNSQGEILYVQGRTGDYLEMTTGDVSTHILRVAKEGLKLAISNCLRKARSTGEEIVHRNVRIAGSEKFNEVDLVVSPIGDKSEGEELFIIVFEPSKLSSTRKHISEDKFDESAALLELEKELDEKEEYLQTTIEELESTNEELKSANEEAQSTNEELQSTNEELETSKEELQSINEELSSTNDELNQKVEELDKANNTLLNLFRSTGLATVFLDRDLKIFKFTPAISTLLELKDSDLGKSLHSFSKIFEYEGLVKDAEAVLRDLVTREAEVHSRDGRYFWMKISPYRTMEDTIEGVVVTLTDFTEKKKQEFELEQHRNHLQELLEEKNQEVIINERKYRNIAENLPGLVLKYRLNVDGSDRVLYVSKGVEEVYGLKPEVVLKTSGLIWQRVHPLDVEMVKATVKKSADELSVWDVEHRILFPDGKVKWVHARGVPVRQNDGSTVWDTVKLDITERKFASEKLKENEILLQSLTDNIPGFVGRYRLHPDGTDELLYISEGVEDVYKISREEALRDSNHIWERIVPEDRERVRQVFSFDNPEQRVECETRIKLRDGAVKWIKIYGSKNLSNETAVIWDSVTLDITESKEAEIALRLQEQKYSDLVHSLNEGIWEIDEEGNTVFITDHMAEMLEYHVDEILGKPMKFFFSPDDREVFDEAMGRRKEGIAETTDVNLLKKGGGIMNARISSTGIFDDQGNFTGALAGVIDITKKKRTEASLRESESQYRAIFENSLTPIVVSNEEGKIIGVNKAATEFFSCPEESLLGTYLEELHFVKPLVDEEEGHLFNFEEKETGEVRFLTKNGDFKFALYSALRIRKGFDLSVFTDITDLKKTQEALKESELLLNETSEVAKVGGWSYDLRTKKLIWTKEMYYLHEVPLDYRPSLEKVLNFYHHEYRSILNDLFIEARSLGKSFTAELKLTTAKGNEITVRAIIRAKKNRKGQVVSLYGNMQDITDLVKTRKELIRAKSHAEEANRAKSEFLAHMSHEIRTPMNGVIGFADLLARTSLDNTQQEYVDLVNKSARNLMEIINDILDFSKIEAGKLELDPVKTDLFNLLESSVDIISFSAGRKDLEVILKLDPNLPRFLMIDPVRLKQILANLLSNAVKFTDKGQVVLEVTCEQILEDHCSFTFSVKDSGIGLSEENRSKLFKAFSQGDSAITRKYGGTGLGLIIADNLVRQMGGEITIESEEGLGSEFYFTIDADVETGTSLIPDAPKNIKRCLLVDDNEEVRTYLASLIEEWGPKVEVFESSAEVIRKLENEGLDYNVLITDYEMPGKNGLELIREFEKAGFHHQHHILMHASTAGDELYKKCEELGVDCRLSKPVKPRELLNTLSGMDRQEIKSKPPQSSGSLPNERALVATKIKKVLIAEDNHVNMLLAKSLITQMLPGARIFEALNGKEAISLAKEVKPEIIFMDIRMPEMDGITATREIRKWEKRVGTQVLIFGLTADATNKEEDASRENGMDAFFSKPIDPVKVKNALSDFIDINSEQTTEPSLKSGTHSFDKDQLMKRLGYNTEAYKDLIQSVISSNSAKIEEIEQALENSDSLRITEVSHYLRSGSLSMSFNQMADLTVLLEEKARANDLEGAREAFKQITREWKTIREVLRESSS